MTYFSEARGLRKGSGLPELRVMVRDLYADLRERDHLTEWFGYECVDAGNAGRTPRARSKSRRAVRPNLIAFHATTALLVASARELLGRDLGDELTDYVEAVEEWIAAITENDPRPSDEASDVSAVLRGVRLRKVVERFVRHHPELSQPAS